MPRLELAFCLVIAASAAGAPPALAAPPAAAGSTSSAAADPLSVADAARRAGRLADAAAAYKAALEAAERDQVPEERRARIAGELGMCELALERYVDAADHLAFAIHQALTPEEARRFLRGLKEAEAQVVTITISANPADAEVLIDGKPIGYVAPTYEVHVLPGSHIVRGRLPGHFTDEAEMNVSRGGTAVVSLRLREAPLRLPAPEPILRPLRAELPADPAPDTSSFPYGIHAEISLVPLMSLGFLPGVSAGGFVDVTFRRGQGSVGLELVALTSQATFDEVLVPTLSLRGELSGCGHRGDYSLCLVLGLGRIDVFDDPTVQAMEVRDGLSGSVGIRPGVEWPLSERLVVRAFAEVHALLGYPSVWVDGALSWTGPPVAGFIGVGGMFSLFGRRR